MYGQNVKEASCLRRAARKWKTQDESSAYTDGSQWFCSHIPAYGLSQTRKKTRLSHFHPSFLHYIPCKKCKNINKRNLIRDNWWAHSFCTLEQRKQLKFLAASLNDLQSNILLLALSNFAEASYDKPVIIIFESTSFLYYSDMIGSRTKQAQQKHWLMTTFIFSDSFFVKESTQNGEKKDKEKK